MPRSKRATVVALTKTSKKTKEQKGEFIEKIQQYADTYKYLWVFHTDNMRNKCMKEVREQWKESKICMGRNAVMRKALGDTAENEHKVNASLITRELEGDVGLMFTNDEPDVVVEWFESYKVPDFARAGNVATEDFIVPEGPIMMNDETAPHSIEPQFRKLGLSSSLKKGIPTMSSPHQVCKKGEKLKPDQAHLLKLFGKAMATFQIQPTKCLNLQDGTIVHGEK